MNSDSLCSVVLQGSPVLIPTDTVVALAASPGHSEQLWKLKRRSLEKPLILMGGDPKDLLEFVLPNYISRAEEMAKMYWPGALTLVVPVQSVLLDFLNPSGSTLGMRVPECNMTRNFLRKTGPLATTSANLSGEPSALTANDASTYFSDIPLLEPFPWPTGSGKASSVIELNESGSWRFLRRGAVIPREIKEK